MQITTTFMPAEPTNLEIEVTANQDDGTFQTDLLCDLNHCGKNVSIFSDGPRTTQNVRCAEHGLLTSFPNQAAFREFVRFIANKILTKTGHELINPGGYMHSGRKPNTARINELYLRSFGFGRTDESMRLLDSNC
jgi:hypothetical protein